jgi:hypothetical protein
MSVTYRPGAFYCDVAPFDGRFLFVYEQGLAVVCEFDLSEVWRTAIPEQLLFLRCAVVNGLLHAIGQAHDSGNALLVNARGVLNLGATFGVQPVAIDGTTAYIVRSPQKYDRINLLNGETQSLPHGIPGSSQGIRDVVNGEIRWADNTHVGTFGGLVLHDYSTRGAVTVGQCDPDQIAGVVNGQRFTAIPNAAFEPHVVEGKGPLRHLRAYAPRRRVHHRTAVSLIQRGTGPRRPLHRHHHDRSRHPCLTFPLL